VSGWKGLSGWGHHNDLSPAKTPLKSKQTAAQNAHSMSGADTQEPVDTVIEIVDENVSDETDAALQVFSHQILFCWMSFHS
jgi:hypothetical protein